jgi:uncharacterized membrane protein
VAATSVSRAAGLLRDPAKCFVVVAALVGVALAFGVPRMSGLDETAHFARAYRISEASLVPDEQAGTGGVVCLPAQVVRTAERLREDALEENPAFDGSGSKHFERCGDGRLAFDVATFAWYSPLGYAPQAVGIAAVRIVGADVATSDLAARLALLAAYVALVAVAIRRAPIGRWAFVAVALLPAAVLEAATSVSAGPITMAVAMLVVSSALRMCSPSDVRPTSRLVVEAAGLTIALALCKPSYLVVGLCYLLPLLGVGARRERWPIVLPLVGAGAVSVLWQRATDHLFVCDVRYFGVTTDADLVTERLVGDPLRFVGALVNAVIDFGGDWIEQLVRFGDRELTWPTYVCVLVFAGFALLAMQRDRESDVPLGAVRRSVFATALVIGVVVVLAAWLVYCSFPEIDFTSSPHARLFLPVLVLLPLALGPFRGRLAALGSIQLPVAIGLVGFYVIWTPSLIAHMR